MARAPAESGAPARKSSKESERLYAAMMGAREAREAFQRGETTREAYYARLDELRSPKRRSFLDFLFCRG